MFKKLSVLIILSCIIIFGLTPVSFGAIATFHTTYANGIQMADDPSLVTKYNTWVGWFVTSNGAGGYKRVHYPEGVGGQGDGTASEGIGYGMLLAVYFNDQTTFDSLWNYKVLHSPNKGLMAWLVSSGGGNVDTNSATDADADIAMALILAHRRWGSTGAVNYNSLATTEVQKVLSNDVDPQDFHMFPGDYCSHSSNDNTYPSYFTPAWYPEFQAQIGGTSWASAGTKAASMLASCRNSGTGLAPEQCTASGGASGSQDSYNSCRIPWRYSLDYVWNGTATSLAQINLDNTFFAGKAASVGAVYNITGGGPTDTTHNGARIGPVGTSFMVTGKTGDLTSYYTEAGAGFSDSGHFYNSTLALLALLQMSGNCPKLFGTPQPTPTPKPGDLFDDCEDGDNANNWGGYWYTYDDSGAPNNGNSLIIPWTDAHWKTLNKTPTPFYMMAPGYTGSGYGTAYGARMTGNVTTTYQYGFVGMGSGTNADSGSPTFVRKDLTVYTGFRFWMKAGNTTNQYYVKISCPSTVTATAGNDYKYQFAGSTTWTLIDVPYINLTQAVGWGIPVVKTLVLANATDLQWQTATQPMPAVDLMVDDIEFYPALPPTPTPTYCLGEDLDNLEDGDHANQFGGYWYTYANSTPSASTVWPAAGVTFTVSAPGANGSQFCARITGTVSNAAVPFIGMGTNMTASGTSYRDLHMFVGLSFYVKGDGNIYSVKLKADPTVLTGGNEFKYTWKTDATAGWEQMTVPFSIFTQERGWGTASTIAAVLTKLQQIQFESKGASHTVSLSIDDLEFECSQGWTPTATMTPLAPTNTDTPIVPTNTNTPLAPTNTFTPTRTYTPTGTYTNTKTDTPTSSPVVPSATNTPLGPTSTFTQIVPSATNTPLGPTSTFTQIVPSETNTPLAPTSTFTQLIPTNTNTPVNTNTPIAPTKTNTPLPPTATNTPILPSPTVTNTIDTSVPVDVLIDDCNDGNNANLQGGYWYTFDDTKSAGDSYVVPMSDDAATKKGVAKVPFYMSGFDHTTNAASGAARITGYVTTTFTYGFVGLGTNLAEPKADKNIGCCQSIKFYARTQLGGPTNYRMKLGTPSVFTALGSANPDGENMFGMQFSVTSTWQQYTIPLATLTQEDWGAAYAYKIASPLTVLPYVQSIQFQTVGQPIANLDLEVDDLTLGSCVGGCMPTPDPTVVIPPTPTITATPNVPLSDVLIDDCTDNNNSNFLGGYWYTFDDAGTVATHSYVWPMSDKYGVIHAVPTYAFIMSTPGNGGSGYAAQMTGTTTNDLGYDFIGMGTNLSEPKGPIELNCCGGIRFYAKSDTPGVMADFRVKLGAAAAYSCGDGGDMYGKVFTVTGTWQQYNISFAQFTAEGWGATSCAPQPSLAQALGKADSIQFQSTGQSKAGIDLWVDDLTFTNCYPGCLNIVAASPTTTPIVPTATNTAVMPTATDTPNVPVPTFTNTPNIPPTATPTNVPPGSTLTFTPTTIIPGVTATSTPYVVVTPSNTIDFMTDPTDPKKQLIMAYPNPAVNATDPVNIAFMVTKGVMEIKVRVFTSGMRFIREADVTVGSGSSSMVNSVIGGTTAGLCNINLKPEFINTLSKGTYYFVIDIKDSSKTVTSQVQKILKLN